MKQLWRERNVENTRRSYVFRLSICEWGFLARRSPRFLSAWTSRLWVRLLSGIIGGALLIALAGPTVAESTKPASLSIGFRADAPPFASISDNAKTLPKGWGGAYRGFAVDICREIVDGISEELGVVDFSEFSVTAANRFFHESGERRKFDFLCDTTSISRERLDSCAFSFPYFVTGISFATSGDPPEISEIDGLKLGLVGGTTAEERLKTEWLRRFDEEVQVQLFGDYQRGVGAIGLGEIDVLFGDQVLLEKAAVDADQRISVSTEIISTELYGFCVNPERPELVKIVNRTLADLFQSGRIYSLFSDHFEASDASRLLITLYAFFSVPER